MDLIVYCFVELGQKAEKRYKKYPFTLNAGMAGRHILDTLKQLSTQRALTKFHDYQITNMVQIQ